MKTSIAQTALIRREMLKEKRLGNLEANAFVLLTALKKLLKDIGNTPLPSASLCHECNANLPKLGRNSSKKCSVHEAQQLVHELENFDG